MKDVDGTSIAISFGVGFLTDGVSSLVKQGAKTGAHTAAKLLAKPGGKFIANTVIGTGANLAKKKQKEKN